MSKSFFLQHQIEHLASQLKQPEATTAALVSYTSATGGFSRNQAVEILKQAGSPSAKRLIELLDLDSEESEENPEKLDPMLTHNNDFRPIITHSPQNEPVSTDPRPLSLQTGHSAPANP